MPPEIQPLTQLLRTFKGRLALLRDQKQAGYTAETVIVIALMVIAAIAIVAIIVAKITNKANSINMG
jgi:hypothetical protein